MRTVGISCGIGVRDIPVASLDAQPDIRRLYITWLSMLNRTTARNKAAHPSYEGCDVDERFLKLSYFLEWAVTRHGWNDERFELDKDILVKGNKRYGPDTCVFVPPAINSLLINRRRRRGDLPIGVSRRGSATRFRAQCRVGLRKIILGWFDDPTEAFHAYKVAKETEIKRVAEVWRPQIEPRAYDALMAYQIEITD